jgi:putative transposase
VKYAFIQEQSDSYPVHRLCSALTVSPSGYASWQAGKRPGKPAAARLGDERLLALIRAIHARTKGAYGSPRIWQELKAQGHRVSKARVERLMREHRIRARHKRRFKATTDSRHTLPVAPNVLDRQFRPERPNAAWVADITYVGTGEGWLYLAVVLDLFDRTVVGWSIKPRMTADLVLDALTMAWFRRRPGPGLVHHSDRGSQYASAAFQAKLGEYRMVCSMSRKANCWDNAVAESFFNSLKNERVHGQRYLTREQARADLFEYIEVFYNRSRRHSALGGQTPARAFEAWIGQHQRILAA